MILGCCGGDGEGHDMGGGYSPGVWNKLREAVWVLGVDYVRTACGRYERSVNRGPGQRRLLEIMCVFGKALLWTL